MFKCLETMGDDLVILEDGYFDCFEATIQAVHEVSGEMDVLDDAYVTSVLGALGKWQEVGAQALQSMHTINPKEWDAQCKALDEATTAFHNACLEADTVQRALLKISHKVANGKQKNPAVQVMEAAIKCAHKIATMAVDNYHTAYPNNLMGKVSLEHLLILVANVQNVLVTFRTSIWRPIANKCIWPLWLKSTGFCKLAPVVKQTLTTILTLCGLIVPPHPSEAPAMPMPLPSPVEEFMKKQMMVGSI